MRLLIIFILGAFGSFAQIGTGQWRLHIPERAIDVAINGQETAVAYEKGIGVYDQSSKELSIWDAVTGLSDNSVACIETCASDNSIFIGYTNGNIDKLKSNSVTNIPAIKLAQVQGSKMIHNMVEYDEHMYIATGFAIVKIDPKKNEVRDTYYPTNGNEAIVDLVFSNDSIYAITKDKMYRGWINSIALADPAQWTLDPRVTPKTVDFLNIEYVNNELHIFARDPLYAGDTIYHVTNSGLQVSFLESFIMEINSTSTIDGRLVVNYSGGARIYNSNFSEYANLGLYTSGAFSNPSAAVYDGSTYWISDFDNGLVEYKGIYQSEHIRMDGPPKSSMYSMAYDKGRIAIVSGGLSGAAPTFNRGGMYQFEDEKWSLFDQNNMTAWNDTIHDYLSVSYNPNNENEVAVSTYSRIPLSILDPSGQVTETYYNGNSLIEATTLGNGWTFISDVEYDNSGNLWILNAYSNEPLKVKSSDGNWYSFGLGSAAKGKITEDLVIDYNGNKWLSIRGEGLFGYKDQGSLGTSSDDQMVNLDIGQSSGALPSNDVSAIAVDFDNEIWIGTDAGFAVLYNSDNAFGAGAGEYNAQRIKLEFEGNVEYVLGATNITDIEVDGANRKWFGTANSGIILLSADGLEILEHHTTENSPLISNNIIDMEINHKTGEMFIITDQGLISYRTDATYEDPEYADVSVFPNPVRPGFSGPVTIQGIKYDSDVKITDAAGNLVYQTTSNGGTATWNCQTLQGERATAGVYLIWTASNTAKGRYVGKFLLMN